MTELTQVCGLLLAAGGGRRMGLPKALLRDGDGTPRLPRTVDQLRKGGCDRVVVVLGARAEEARPLLEDAGLTRAAGVEVVVAESWDSGMAASLLTGLGAVEDGATDGEGLLVHLVDLPDVNAPVVERVVAAWREDGAPADALLRAAYAGEPGHPVLLGPDHRAGLAADVAAALAREVGADFGARHYLADRRVHLVECEDLATGHDVDRPEDLR